MHSSVYGDRLKLLYPVVEAGMSDSGCVDNVLEFLCMAGGRELPEVIFQCMLTLTKDGSWLKIMMDDMVAYILLINITVLRIMGRCL